jgi:hypothetical protein
VKCQKEEEEIQALFFSSVQLLSLAISFFPSLTRVVHSPTSSPSSSSSSTTTSQGDGPGDHGV